MKRIGIIKQDGMIHARLDNGMRERVRQYAERYHMGESQIIREALSIWLNMQPKEDICSTTTK